MWIGLGLAICYVTFRLAVCRPHPAGRSLRMLLH